MAANINVDWNELNIKSGEMKKEATNLRSSVDLIQKEVVSLDRTWQSDASDTMLGKMKSMTGVFERFEQVVKDYAKFLEETAKHYSETENAVNEATNELEFK